jgi:hypothetical protein|tara:strand:+ start:349 stop:582 length:234 start_codon:yes stop_codon:yes gene_type:complete
MEIKSDAWSKFINDAMDPDSDTSNFKYDFKVISKKYGQAYIVFCKEMWKANEGVMTEDEFIKMNGNMPRAFFDKIIG